ncbi:hypothetical protein, partial [Sphingobacterium micropteri]|uniref:hypothetical protein n=1 Tax=Sphingobacterium micropteri TaxID=2763501 RepID=UPI001CC28429
WLELSSLKRSFSKISFCFPPVDFDIFFLFFTEKVSSYSRNRHSPLLYKLVDRQRWREPLPARLCIPLYSTAGQAGPLALQMQAKITQHNALCTHTHRQVGVKQRPLSPTAA